MKICLEKEIEIVVFFEESLNKRKGHHMFTLGSSAQNVYKNVYNSIYNLFNFGDYESKVKNHLIILGMDLTNE